APETSPRPASPSREGGVVLDGRSAESGLDTEGHMEIILDRREASSTLAAGLRARGIRPVFRHLVTGDVRIGPRLLLERKTAKDLHASVRDGRLLSQVRRLAAAAPRAGLLLETGQGLEGGTHPNAVHGALAWMAFDLGLSVICVRDASESAAFLAMAARREIAWLDALEAAQAPKDEEGTQRALRAAQRALEAEDERSGMNDRWTAESQRRRASLLEAIEGVGPVTAKALAESFGSIAAIANAEADELAKVAGIGAGRAAEVHRALHG
ncbi:MAG: ERCC4 domain-containing protein, partial [Candidatus Poseidoniaceae archaeon]